MYHLELLVKKNENSYVLSNDGLFFAPVYEAAFVFNR